jgi:hypothetical protein
MSASESKDERKANLFREQSRIAAETEARLAADPAVQAWLQQCRFDGKGLLKAYAEQKANYLINGPGWLEQEQFMAGWPRKQAYDRLWQIQQKKLFDLQCQWRACQLELDEVSDGREFAAWGKAIQQCPVLDPISPDDLELYLAYLNSDSCPDLAADAITAHDWQDYEGFRNWVLLEEAGSGSPGHDMVRDDLPDALADSLGHLFNMFYRYPDWYAYYDLYRGTGQLLRLPQVRFVEEDAPEPAADEAAASTALPAAAPEPAAELSLRYLNARDLPLTETLLKRFEQPELLHYMRVMEYEPEEDSLTEAARRTYHLLSEIAQQVPIQAGSDWRQCLLDAYLAHQQRVVSRALRQVYAEYCQREAAGLPHPLPE